jgi:ATP synthase protein I
MKNTAADTDIDSELGDEVSDFKPLTSEEAQDWRRRNPQMSVWRFVVVQAVVGVLVCRTYCHRVLSPDDRAYW